MPTAGTEATPAACGVPRNERMILGYNTNGLAHHRLPEALDLLAQEGYGGVALTLDVGPLDPFERSPEDWKALREQLRTRNLACVVETGGRFLLDPGRKHWPNLCTASPEQAARREDFYRRALRIAASLDASCVSLWSGIAEDESDLAFERLLPRLDSLLDAARDEGVRLAFEPEPGMLVGDLSDYRRLRASLGRDDLGTTLDVGHLVVSESAPHHEHLREFADSLLNVHLDDARPGVHEHLPFGQGALDLPAVLRTLEEMNFSGMASVELSRDAHRGADAVCESMAALRAARD